jgi:hypothetical protein
MSDVDALSNVIRTADGNHELGSGALAEAILGSNWLAEHDRQVRAEAIRAFVGRQSVVYRKHSGDAVTEDMVLAIRELGLQAYDFYDDKEGQGWLSGRVAAAILADLDGTQVESEPATAQPPGAPTR